MASDESLVRLEAGVLTVVPLPRRELLGWLARLEPLDGASPDVNDDDLLPLDDAEVGRGTCSIPTRSSRLCATRPAPSLWTEAHAVAEALTVVTGNGREFRRVPRRNVVDWR